MPIIPNLHAKALSASLQTPIFTPLPNKWKGGKSAQLYSRTLILPQLPVGRITGSSKVPQKGVILSLASSFFVTAPVRDQSLQSNHPSLILLSFSVFRFPDEIFPAGRRLQATLFSPLTLYSSLSYTRPKKQLVIPWLFSHQWRPLFDFSPANPFF